VLYIMADIKPTDIKPDVETSTWPFPTDIEEQLAIDAGKSNKNVWALKLPRFLLERWERVPEAGVELGTLVVDSSYILFSAPSTITHADPLSSRVNPPTIHLRLPAETEAEAAETEAQAGESSTMGARPSKRRKYDTRGIPDEYEVQVPSERAKNTFVFQETKRDWGLGQDGKKRTKERGTLRGSPWVGGCS
jgi:transcription initiation factor TFIIF subunit beta